MADPFRKLPPGRCRGKPISGVDAVARKCGNPPASENRKQMLRDGGRFSVSAGVNCSRIKPIDL